MQCWTLGRQRGEKHVGCLSVCLAVSLVQCSLSTEPNHTHNQCAEKHVSCIVRYIPEISNFRTDQSLRLFLTEVFQQG